MTQHHYQPSLYPLYCICGHKHDDIVHGFPPTPPRVEPKAVARRTDPDTSWEAARSVTNLRHSQAEVLAMLKTRGPMTDEEMAAFNENQSPSGLRTRRSELARMGLVVDSGKRKVGSTGRRMIVWAVR